MELYNFDFSKKIFYHIEKIIEYKNGKRPFPITVEVDLTNKCNHKCSFCFYSEHLKTSKATLDTKLIKERISELGRLGTKGVSFTGGGEPTLHKDFYEIIEHTKKEGIDIGCISNGSNIRKKYHSEIMQNLQWIRISMGGGDTESYKKIQGVDHFDRVVENLLNLCISKTNSGSKLNIGVRILLNESNIDSLNNIAKIIMQAKGLNYLQLAQDQYTKPGNTFWQSEKTQLGIKETTELLKNYDIKVLASGYVPLQNGLHIPRTCYAHFFQIAITAEGDVVFCKNGRGEEKVYIGNIKKSTLDEIWQGKKTKALENLLAPSNCNLYCKNIALNIAMEQTLYPNKEMTPNFIS